MVAIFPELPLKIVKKKAKDVGLVKHSL